MSEPILGEIKAFGFNFAPRGWASCDGQLLAIASNTALFSLLGTTYGGDGRTTFALPDLRGRSQIHQGTGNGLQNRTIGSRAGQQSLSVTLQATNLPAHNHSLHGETAVADSRNPQGKLLASGDSNIYGAPVPAENKTFAAEAIGNTGDGAPLNLGIEDPYLVVNVCIALQGVFPSRN